MRILYLIKGLGLGGAERQVADLANSYSSNGNVVCVAYFLAHKNALHEEIQQNGSEVYCLSAKGVVTIASIFQLYNLLKTFKPDVVHAHLPIPGILARLLKPFSNFWLVYTEHNVISRLNPLVRWFNLATYGLNNYSISCSSQVNKSLNGRGIVIENGIDTKLITEKCKNHIDIRRKLNLEPNAFIGICVANLLKKKNHQLLIRASSQIIKNHDSKLHLILVGQNGTERKSLEELVKELGIDNRVTFWGPDPDPVPIVCSADVFILSSTFEGLPISLLEAAGASVPAVCTSVGGITEVIVDGETGLLVPSNNLNKLAEAIYRLETDPETRKVMGNAAHERVNRHFSFEKMTKELTCLYQRGIHSKP